MEAWLASPQILDQMGQIGRSVMYAFLRIMLLEKLFKKNVTENMSVNASAQTLDSVHGLNQQVKLLTYSLQYIISIVVLVQIGTNLN
jgi:hypothetical protein